MRVRIQATTTQRSLSKAIRQLQPRYRASHIRLVYETVEPVILEATWPVVIERPYRDDAVVIKEWSVDVSKEDILRVRRRIGRWYDAGNLLMLLGQMCLKWVGVKWNSWKSNPHQDICVDIALDLLGIGKPEKTDIDSFVDMMEANANILGKSN